MKYLKKIVGERIYLSPMNKEDVEIFANWMNDFDVTDYIGRSGMLVTFSDEQKYLDNISNKNFIQFAIVTLEDDKLIGTISLENIIYINRSAILGIFIGDKEYRNNGYGTEAIKLLLDYGFNYMNLHSIRLDVIDFNERAKKCYKKCGFKENGRVRESIFINGKYYDVIKMDILSDEFKESCIKNKLV